MNQKESLLDIINSYQQDEDLHPYDPGHWKYLLLDNNYIGDGNSNQEELIQNAENANFYINERLPLELFELYQKRCKFKIPYCLKELWLITNGFIFTKDAKETSQICPSSMPIRLSILPIEAAFGGTEVIAGNKKLPANPILDPDLFKDVLEFGFIKKRKVGIKGLLKNCIFLELFSSDLLCYTIYKMDHNAKEKYHQLYIILEYGPYPLSLSISEYINAMFEFKGVVFGWPTMFILEDNVEKNVLERKEELIASAKQNSKLLNLNINFNKYGL